MQVHLERELLISSQRYIDWDVVAEKIAAADYVVNVTPEFEIEGVGAVRAIIDGHHSYAAAIEAGVSPVFVELTATENDRIALINSGDIDGYLEAAYHDSTWYDVETGCDIF